MDSTSSYSHPPANRVVIGVGCDRGATPATLAQTLRDALQDAGLDELAVAALATIDIKQDEPAISSLAEWYGWPLVCYTAAELVNIDVPNPSATVERHTGTPAVAEAAALRYANADKCALLIEKRRRVGSDNRNVTVAIALLHEPGQPPIKPGKIMVVGIGPGDSGLICDRARQAITAADVVIGYRTYLKLINELLGDSKVISKGMTEELERAELAYAHAAQGNTVALISSGDAGIYGMAAPTYELLRERGNAIDPTVIPGITALSASASLLGAPLSHDFCTISLSDLLTPWPIIASRLDAAGRGDFVIALYNPASKKRTRHIRVAQQILLRYRSPDTPVGVIRSAYREGQSIDQTTLGELHTSSLDMLSTVLIGNSSTYQQDGCMITPRGYQAKYGCQPASATAQPTTLQGASQNPKLPSAAGHPRGGGRRESFPGGFWALSLAPQTATTGDSRRQTAIFRGSPQLKRGQSLPLGLECWHTQVRAWLREQDNPQITSAMHHFAAPWAEIVAAVDEHLTTADDPWSSRQIAGAPALAEALAEISCSPSLQATTATLEGAHLKLDFDADGISLTAQEIQLSAVSAQLTIDMEQVRHRFMLNGPGNEKSLELGDSHGHLLLRLAPQRSF